jgi:dissimilatory sulfite reductase (desulfoviridin) alpha/beta subunit
MNWIWDEAVSAVIQIVGAWRKDANPDERMKEWINRIGWDRFFKKTGIKVSIKDIDGYLNFVCFVLLWFNQSMIKIYLAS